MHLRILNSTRFIAGKIDTKFIENGLNIPQDPQELESQRQIAALASALLAHGRRATAHERAASHSKDEHAAWRNRRAAGALAQ